MNRVLMTEHLRLVIYVVKPLIDPDDAHVAKDFIHIHVKKIRNINILLK